MNSLHFILFAAFVVMYVDSTLVGNNKNSDCEKNLFVKRCSGCRGVCVPVDKNMTDTWTSSISKLLVSKEGVDTYEKYLRACNLMHEAKLLDVFKKTDEVSPYKAHPYFNENNDVLLRRALGFLNVHNQLLEVGVLKSVTEPYHLKQYTQAVQYYLREVMKNEYFKFQQKLIKDIEQLGQLDAYVCHYERF